MAGTRSATANSQRPNPESPCASSSAPSRGAPHGGGEALEASPGEVRAAGAAFAHMQDEALEVAEKFEAGQPTATGPAEAEPADLLKPLAAAYRAAEAGDVAEAQAQLGTAIQLWPVVEGAIAAKSPTESPS